MTRRGTSPPEVCYGKVFGCSRAFVPFAGEGRPVLGGRREGCDIPGWGSSRSYEPVREWKRSEDGYQRDVLFGSGLEGEAGNGGEGEEKGGVWGGWITE